MIRTIEMPILHCEIAEFLDPRIHEAAPGTPSFALHGFRGYLRFDVGNHQKV